MIEKAAGQPTNEARQVSTEAGEKLSKSAVESVVSMKPAFRHSLVGGTLAHSTTGTETMEWKHVQDAYLAECAKARAGDLGTASNMLTAQALTLDAMFTEMLSRATKNIGRYPDAMDRYMRLALKAQAQSRATLEALAKIHQPREQVVRHVHVHEGGQAIVAEQFHMNGQGVTNAGIADQSNAQGASIASLPSPDPLGYGVPITGGAREAEMQDARRDQPRRATRKSKRA